MDALSQLIQFYNNSDKDDLYGQLAGNVLRNIKAFPEKSSYDMAELCYVAPSTLRKLSTKLGYKSYNSFRAEIKLALDSYETLYHYRPVAYGDAGTSRRMLIDYVFSMTQEVERRISPEQLHEIVCKMKKADTIEIYCDFVTAHIQRLEADLLLAGHSVSVFTELQSKRRMEAMDRAPDLAIFILLEIPAAGRLRKLVEKLKAAGTCVLVIDNNSSLSPRRAADYVLNFRGELSLMDAFALDVIVALLVSAHQDSLMETPEEEE